MAGRHFLEGESFLIIFLQAHCLLELAVGKTIFVHNKSVTRAGMNYLEFIDIEGTRHANPMKRLNALTFQPSIKDGFRFEEGNKVQWLSFAFVQQTLPGRANPPTYARILAKLHTR